MVWLWFCSLFSYQHESGTFETYEKKNYIYSMRFDLVIDFIVVNRHSHRRMNDFFYSYVLFHGKVSGHINNNWSHGLMVLHLLLAVNSGSYVCVWWQIQHSHFASLCDLVATICCQKWEICFIILLKSAKKNSSYINTLFGQVTKHKRHTHVKINLNNLKNIPVWGVIDFAASQNIFMMHADPSSPCLK